MIELHSWKTPNGHKVTMALEELGLDYRIHPIDIGKGQQFDPAFLSIAPNNRIPAIVDDDPADGGEAVALFESGAILLYLAQKAGALLPAEERSRLEATQWLFWQMAGLGPMMGQALHFRRFAPEPVPYAVDRYTAEIARLFRVLDRHLADRPFIAGGDYSVADIACYPWIVLHEWAGQSLDDFPELRRWFEAIRDRPATERAYAIDYVR
ncbi:glutathione S-transferase N-terminal domain-containing protein [Sphingomonas sp. BK580]|uniref:glutathione S-transferase N-terminal domain-containing protein n=1 Tax=Sphingomonas sp. BK580 TaxID=2586972 RepID=UPI00161E0B06|nr:glutathione S-transferase N-terminal domain-containing protein [Sphingomonas sp. BK580]MBB3695629.1 GST-like protein [Sphingomonas sp. BK580]